MNLDQGLFALLATEGFWGGVLASILAALILGLASVIFRNSFQTFKRFVARGNQDGQIFDAALRASSPFAPFAFGIAQGRGLRYFIVAMIITYFGDISASFIFPFHVTFYIISMLYLFLSLRWFFKIERRALELISKHVDELDVESPAKLREDLKRNQGYAQEDW